MNQRNLYISDLHLFHKNVTKAGKNFDSRPYENIEEMNDDILQRWNSSVTNIDHVYICGGRSSKRLFLCIGTYFAPSGFYDEGCGML